MIMSQAQFDNISNRLKVFYLKGKDITDDFCKILVEEAEKEMFARTNRMEYPKVPYTIMNENDEEIEVIPNDYNKHSQEILDTMLLIVCKIAIKNFFGYDDSRKLTTIQEGDRRLSFAERGIFYNAERGLNDLISTVRRVYKV